MLVFIYADQDHITLEPFSSLELAKKFADTKRSSKLEWVAQGEEYYRGEYEVIYVKALHSEIPNVTKKKKVKKEK